MTISAAVYHPDTSISLKPFEPDHCAAAVDRPGSWGSGQCRRKGVNTEQGHKWCRQHTPSIMQAKLDADRKRVESWITVRKFTQAKQEALDKVGHLAIDYFAGAGTMEEIEAAVIEYNKF